jgi:hypothetical protein
MRKHKKKSLSGGKRENSKWSTKCEKQYKNSMVLVRERTIPTERTPLVGEVSANFGERGCRLVNAMHPYGRILGF